MCKPEMERQKSSFCRIHRGMSHFPSAQSIFFRCDNLVEIVGWTILTRRGERRVMQNFSHFAFGISFFEEKKTSANLTRRQRRLAMQNFSNFAKRQKPPKAAKSLRNMRSRAKGQRAVGRKLSKVSQAPGQTSLCPEEKNVKRKF